MLFNRKIRSIAFAVALAGACADLAFAASDRAVSFYQDAIARMDRKDLAGAIVQLKNALQADPGMLAAQLLLGKAYLADSQAEAAQEVLEKALRSGLDRAEVTIPLGHALLLQGKGADFLARFPGDVLSGSVRAEYLVLKAQALRQGSDPDGALAALDEAITLDPSTVEAYLSAADLYLSRGRSADAARYVERAQSVAPENPRVWMIRGNVLQSTGQLASAIDAFGKALRLEPLYADARLARLSLLIDTGRERDAAEDVEFVSKNFPKEPRGNYLRAVYLARKGDGAGAREALAAAGNLLAPIAPEVMRRRAPELLMLSGLVFHGLNQMERAQAYLEAFLGLYPGNSAARKLLGSVFLQRRDFNNAARTLESVERVAPDDPQVLAMLGGAYLGQGKADSATRKLQRALELGGGAPDTQAWLGAGLIQTGQTAAGLKQMSAAFERAPDNAALASTLAIAYAQKGEPKKAVVVLKKALQTVPKHPLLLNLLGAASTAAGDAAGARKAYEQAAAASPGYEPPLLNLAKLDIAEGRTEDALARLSRVLKANHKSVEAMREMARLEHRRGRTKEALEWMEKAYGLEPANVALTADFVDFLIASGKPARAVEVGRYAEARYPENLTVLTVLAKALVAAGDSTNARNLLGKMTRLANFDPVRQHEIAQLQLLSGNPSGAAYSLDKALADNPDHLPARILMVEVEQALGRDGAAETRASALLKSYPDLARVHRLMGDIRLRAGRFAEAADSYQRAQSREPSTDHAVRYATALMRGGNMAKGVEVIRDWASQHPKDPLASRALGEAHMRAGQYGAARKILAGLAAQREDYSVLNSLAAATLLDGAAGEAVTIAKRALALAPEDAAVLDTAGWAMVRAGDLDMGIKHLREARLRSPRDAEIRYHLASALHKAGKVNEARDELREALRLALDFPEAGDARTLAKQLELI